MLHFPLQFHSIFTFFCTISTAKDCKCKCGDKMDMEDMCVSGKWDGKEQKMIVSSNCMYDCWKCRMQSSFRLLNLGDCNGSGGQWHYFIEAFQVVFRCCIFPYSFMAYSLFFCTISTAKDCKCKCGDKKDMEDMCVSGKWDGKEQKMIVSNSCKWSCWKYRMEDSFKGQPMSYCSEQPC